MVTGTGSSVQDREKKGGGDWGGGDRRHWRGKGSMSSPTGIGSRRRVDMGEGEGDI